MGMLDAFRRRSPSIKLNAIVYKDGEEWVAHCLQMDLVAANSTREEVVKDIIDLIKAQVIFAIQNDNLGALFVPAPPEEWKKLALAASCEIKKIDIYLEKDEKEDHRHHHHHSKVNEVELCFA